VYAHHLYNVSSTSTNPDSGLSALTALNAAYPTQMKFMTEYYASPGINDAWNIHNALAVGNDNAYIYWGLTWPSTISNGQAADQQGLIYIDNPFNAQSTWAFSKGWSYNDSYYAMKHFSFFVKPGYIRYNSLVNNTDERMSVYQSPDGKTTVIVVMNLSATTTDGLSMNLSNIAYTTSTVYRSTFSTPIATGERWANLGGYSSNGLSLPPQSIATIVLQ
jgi:O-glycosyl hydrolase